jgi:hypothetical protein
MPENNVQHIQQIPRFGRSRRNYDELTIKAPAPHLQLKDDEEENDNLDFDALKEELKALEEELKKEENIFFSQSLFPNQSIFLIPSLKSAKARLCQAPQARKQAKTLRTLQQPSQLFSDRSGVLVLVAQAKAPVLVPAVLPHLRQARPQQALPRF